MSVSLSRVFGSQSPRWTAAGAKLVCEQLIDFRSVGTRPDILVVLPYFNAERWIDSCLAALAANDQPHDILIVDDGDRPAEAHVKPQDNLAILRIEPKVGLIGALNAAATFALDHSYAFYVRQDADDLAYPWRLATQRQLLLETNADLVFSPARAVDETGQVLFRGTSGAILTQDPTRALRYGNPYTHSTWFLRTSLFQRLGGYDPNFKAAEDYEFLQRIARHGVIAMTPQVLLDYRVHGGSATAQSLACSIATIKVQAHYFDPGQPASYLGMMRAVAAAATPRSWKTQARTWLSKRRSAT